MTKEQLELLLKYIDMRAEHACHFIDMHYTDEELNLRQDLKWTLQDEKEI
jgi:hypothetical protein